MKKKILEALNKIGERIDKMTPADAQQMLDNVEHGPIALGLNSDLIEQALEYKARLYKVFSSYVVDFGPAYEQPEYFLFSEECANDSKYTRSSDIKITASEIYSLAA